MTNSFPGEVRFNSDLEVDLRDGRSVLVRLPEGESPSLIRRTRDAFHDNWIDFNLSGETRTPIDFLFDEFEPDRPVGSLKDLRRLYQLPNFKGRILAVHCTEAGEWKHWIPFLSDFADFSRSIDRYDQTKILLLCMGRDAGAASHVNDVLLTERTLDGYFGRIDSRLAAHEVLTKKNRTALDYEISESICCELALWDTSLAAQLAELPVTTLFDPFEVLRGLGNELGFCETPDVTPVEGLWRGLFRTTDQSGRWHSCHLAVTGRVEEIRKRVWRGQIASILPFLEGERQKLIDIYRHQLRLPHRDKEGRVLVTDLEDLELGHLYTQFLGSTSRVPAESIHAVHLLREVRNRLAHFQPVTADVVSRGLLAPMPWQDLA